jgi:hypothetical protein|tara:strand:- start:1512 stop:2039 length:528 start_codon:yes stop_codon:yes gene_type:complete
VNYKRAVLTIATLGFTYFILTRVGFTTQQWAVLRKLNPKAKAKLKKFIKRVQDELGYQVVLTSGYRTFAEQESLYNNGKTTSQAGDSFHNYGMAIDINAVKLGAWLRMGSSKYSWENSGIVDIAKEEGLRWGGDFSNFYDPVHFDLGNEYNVSTLKDKAFSIYGNNPSDIKGNKI